MRVESSRMKLLPLLKKPQRAILPFLTCKDTARRKSSLKQEASSHQTFNLPVTRSCKYFQSPALRNKFLLFISRSVYKTQTYFNNVYTHT